MRGLERPDFRGSFDGVLHLPGYLGIDIALVFIRILLRFPEAHGHSLALVFIVERKLITKSFLFFEQWSDVVIDKYQLGNIHDTRCEGQCLESCHNSRSRRLGAYAHMSIPELDAMRYACGLCSLNELCWPMRLEPADLERLQAMVRHAGPLAAGSFLFHVGDPFTAIYALRSGCIKSFSIDASGHESVHGFHLRGELLGFDAVHPDRHRCNALVLEDSSLCVIPYQDIARLSTAFPSLQNQVLRMMSREFSRHLMFAEGSGATQRLALFLTDMYARLRQPGTAEYRFTLPMTREDISNHLGITAETLSRLFAKLQRDGVIDVERRQVFLADPIRLELIAQGIS